VHVSCTVLIPNSAPLMMMIACSQIHLLPTTISWGMAKPFTYIIGLANHFAEKVIRQPAKEARLLEINWTQYIVGL